MNSFGEGKPEFGHKQKYHPDIDAGARGNGLTII
jgi:hypothetical protein